MIVGSSVVVQIVKIRRFPFLSLIFVQIVADQIHNIRGRRALRQGEVRLQPDEFQCLVQSLQYGLSVFFDFPILNDNMLKRLRARVGQVDLPRIGVCLIDADIIDIPLVGHLAKGTPADGVVGHPEANIILRTRARFALGGIARDRRETDGIGQIHACVSVAVGRKAQAGEAQMQRIVVDLHQNIFAVRPDIGFGNRHTVVRERPAGILLRVKDRRAGGSVLVGILRQNIRQRHLGGVAIAVLTAARRGLSVDDEGKIHIVRSSR